MLECVVAPTLEGAKARELVMDSPVVGVVVERTRDRVVSGLVVA